MNPFLGHLLERSFATTEGLRPRLPSLFEPVSTDVPGSPPVPLGTAGPEWDETLNDDSDRQEDTAGLRMATSAQEVEIGPLGEINPTLPSARIRAENSRSAPIPMPATGANRTPSAPEEPSESPVESRPLAKVPAVTPPVAIASPSPPISASPAPTVVLSRKVANTPAEPSESPAETRPVIAISPAPPSVSVAPFGPPPSTRQVADRIAPHEGQARRPIGPNPVEWPSSAASGARPAEQHPGTSATESRLAGAGPTVLIERIVRFDQDPQRPTTKVATLKAEWRERLIESPPLEGNSVTPLPAPQPPAAPQSRKPADSAAAPGIPQTVVPQQTRLALRPVSLPPIVPAASTRPSAAPTIQVTIGRIEVRATPPAPATPRKAPAKSAAMSLEDYLKQRSEGRR
jgi:hypothetical protein